MAVLKKNLLIIDKWSWIHGFFTKNVTGRMTIYKDVDEQEEDRMQTRSRRQETDLLQVVMFYSCGL